MRLISPFLDRPIIDDKGSNLAPKTGIPNAHPSYRISFVTALKEGLQPTFHLHIVVIVMTCSYFGKQKEFEAQGFSDLLSKVGLYLSLMCIVPGGSPVDCSRGIIFLTADGNLQFGERGLV